MIKYSVRFILLKHKNNKYNTLCITCYDFLFQISLKLMLCLKLDNYKTSNYDFTIFLI
jgi:hypothetical protein